MFSDYVEFEKKKVACRECPIGKTYDCVVRSFGCKNDPVAMVIGEAPGRDEIEEGQPFVGKSGKLLRLTLNEFGYRKNNTLISNVIPCRPENNQFPKDDALVTECFNRWLRNEIVLVGPQFILLVGSQPLKFVLHRQGITKNRGKTFHLPWNKNISCIPTFHPSYVQRKSHMEDGEEITSLFRRDIKQLAIEAGFFEDENCNNG